MSSFTVKVRILGEAATGPAVNRALRDLNKLERQAARFDKKFAQAQKGRQRASRGFAGNAFGGPARGGGGFSDRARGVPVAGGGVVGQGLQSRGGRQSRQDRGDNRINRAAVLGGLSSSLGRAARATRSAFFAPIDAARQFEDVMLDVGAKTNATVEQMELLEQQARKLGSSQRFQFGATDVGTAQGFLAQAGFSPEQIRASVTATLDLAKAGNETVSFASDFLSDIVTPFGVIAKDSSIQTVEKQMRRFADTFVFTTNSANVTQRQLAAALSNVAPTAAAAGVQIEDLSALVGILGGAAIKSGKAGTDLRNVLLNVANVKPRGAGALAAIGLTPEDLLDTKGNIKNVFDILGLLDTQLNKFGFTSKEKGGTRSKILETLFGKRTVTSVNRLLQAQASGEATDFRADVRGKSKGEAARVAKKKANSTSGKLAAARAGFEALQIEIGTSFTPTLLTLLKGIKPLVDSLAKFIAKNPEFTGQVGKLLLLTTGLSSFMSVFAGAATVALAATGGWMKLGGAASTAGGQATAASGKFGKFSGAIGAFGAGFAVGGLLDSFFGLSDKIAKMLGVVEESGRETVRGEFRLSDEKRERLTGATKERQDVINRLESPITAALTADTFNPFKAIDQVNSAQEDLARLDKEIARIKRDAGLAQDIKEGPETNTELQRLAPQLVKVEVSVGADDRLRARVVGGVGADGADTGRQTEGL